MPRRDDIKSILIIGAGPIVIGQACEFDYSGTQACKALKAEGYRVILVNSNPATIMTDPDLADATYIEPVTAAAVEKIIAKERPDAILPTMGGQTALNVTLELHENGALTRHDVTLIGASPDAIDKAENRARFNVAMEKIGLDVPKNAVVSTMEEAWEALAQTGLPAIIRPSFTLGGSGGGVAHTREEFEQIVREGLHISPTTQVLIDQSLLGWKEYEMEVVRDKADNAIIICSIENVDPMGVHTGDSITVAPAQTLTDKEYQIMRDASLAVLREIGVETGGSNVQFAVNPANGEMVVIEMNPRVSRSSALASKATGFPIAKVAALLAVGYTLDEIRNDCTEVTPASFEPSIDYVVTKIPRFTFEKFGVKERTLSSAMKSVGEAMAIGGTFAESLQKALRSLETGLSGLDSIAGRASADELKEMIATPTPERLLLVADALRAGVTPQQVQEITAFDPWFTAQLAEIVEAELRLTREGAPQDASKMRAYKSMGFSDAQIARATGMQEEDIYAKRHALGVHPAYKRVDTCAAEFESRTPYMYSTYGATYFDPQRGALSACEAGASERKKAVILGSGPNRIGQGIEFDYTCVHAALTCRKQGVESIMINCNPETVSTDYDTSDRLYFEPLTGEDVLEVLRVERAEGELAGVNVQFGGQTPLKLARRLEGAGIPLLGTSPASIDLAEDREQFKELIERLALKQPRNDIASNAGEAQAQAAQVGFPLVVRPSFVLGGRAMAIVHSQEELVRYLTEMTGCFDSGPLLLDHFLTNAVEVDVDAICDGRDVYIAGIMEHIEEAGVHSGDSACALPSFSLSDAVQEEISRQTALLAREFNVHGLMNIQFAVKDDVVYILEVNPRASRTVPFVAKATGTPVAMIAMRAMMGDELRDILASAGINAADIKRGDGLYIAPRPKHVSIKEVVFPFARFPDADVLLGPEMKSTGEVMGVDMHMSGAFAKAQMAAFNDMKLSGTVFISVRDEDKQSALPLARRLLEYGYTLIATSGTASFLQEVGLQVQRVNKVREGSPHIVDMISDGQVQLVINTTSGAQSIRDSFSIRRTALMQKVPYNTTISGAREMVGALCHLLDISKDAQADGNFVLEVYPAQDYSAA